MEDRRFYAQRKVQTRYGVYGDRRKIEGDESGKLG